MYNTNTPIHPHPNCCDSLGYGLLGNEVKNMVKKKINIKRKGGKMKKTNVKKTEVKEESIAERVLKNAMPTKKENTIAEKAEDKVPNMLDKMLGKTTTKETNTETAEEKVKRFIK